MTGPSPNMRDKFRKAAQASADAVGSPWALVAGLALTLAWLASGPFFHYSDTWQLIINSSTSVVTFLMVFLIQNTQNRDARVIHMKLDELIRALGPARNELVQMEGLTDKELDLLSKEFEDLRDQAATGLARIQERKRRGLGNGDSGLEKTSHRS
jgi:low affinity Fe/Cu permease